MPTRRWQTSKSSARFTKPWRSGIPRAAVEVAEAHRPRWCCGVDPQTCPELELRAVGARSARQSALFRIGLAVIHHGAGMRCPPVGKPRIACRLAPDPVIVLERRRTAEFRQRAGTPAKDADQIGPLRSEE